MRTEKDGAQAGKLKRQGWEAWQCPVFSGKQEAGHLRRVGVSGVGWRRFEKSKSLAEALRKMGRETSQGLKAAIKAQLSSEAMQVGQP